MAFDDTMTELDLDVHVDKIGHGDCSNRGDIEPDLAVDGLSESLLSRLLGLLGVGRA